MISLCFGMQEIYVIEFTNLVCERKMTLLVSVMCLNMQEEEILLSRLMPNVKCLYMWSNCRSMCTYIIMHEIYVQWQLHLNLQPFTMFSFFHM